MCVCVCLSVLPVRKSDTTCVVVHIVFTGQLTGLTILTYNYDDDSTKGSHDSKGSGWPLGGQAGHFCCHGEQSRNLDSPYTPSCILA